MDLPAGGAPPPTPGARKGELLRMRVGDVDFAAGVVRIREKKRAHGRRTTRRVPLSATLAAILKDWLADPPRRPLPVLPRPRRSGGARSGAARPGICGRTGPAPIRQGWRASRSGQRPGILPLTEDEAGDHLKRTLAGLANGR